MRASLIVITCVAACSGKKDAPPPAPQPPAPTTPATPTTPPPAPVAPAIVVSLSINSGIEIEIARGEPMLLVVGLVDPRDPPVKISIAADTLRIEARDAKGQPVSWPFHAVKPSPVIELQRSAIAAWRLAPDEVTAIAPGKYAAVATLALPGGAPRVSVPVTVSIVDRPAASTLLAAVDAKWAGDPTRAGTIVDELLAKQPKDYQARAFKGDLLVAAGDKRGALREYNAALTAFRAAYPKAQEPPIELLRKRNKLLLEVEIKP